MRSLFNKGKSFFGVCLFHFNGIYNRNSISFSWPAGKRTRYHADYLISIVSRKRDLMKRFKVKLHGENFLLNIDGELKKFGFYATIFVKAENPQEAEKIAIILIHQNPNLRDTVLNENIDRPKINLEEIKEVGFLKFFAKKSTTDFTFYPEDKE